MEYESPSLRALSLMRTTAIIRDGILVIVAAAIAFAVFNNGYKISAIVIVSIALVFALIGIFLLPKIRFKRYKYLIRPDRIEIVEGIFWVSRTIVPIDRIHQIDIKKGPLDNIFDIAKVVVTTAGSAATFGFLEPERASEIAEHLNATIAKKLSKNGGSENV